MKLHRRNTRRIRRAAVAMACVAALLALPAVSSARISPADPPAPQQTSAPAQSPTVVTVVKKDDGRTLAIVLSSTALGIALLASGYAAARTHGLRGTQPGSAS